MPTSRIIVRRKLIYKRFYERLTPSLLQPVKTISMLKGAHTKFPSPLYNKSIFNTVLFDRNPFWVSHKTTRKKEKKKRLSNFTVLLVLFRWHRGSNRIKTCCQHLAHTHARTHARTHTNTHTQSLTHTTHHTHTHHTHTHTHTPARPPPPPPPHTHTHARARARADNTSWRAHRT